MNQWQQLYAATVRKLNTWEISPRAKAIGLEIANNSLAVGQPEVELWQRELVTLTGYSEHCVSKGVTELMTAGVLQRRGRRGEGPRIYRLLTNAEMIEPERLIDEAAAREVRAAVQARNVARLPGDDPGGQAVLLRTIDEQLSDDLAAGSAERALADNAEDVSQWTPGRLSEACRRSIVGYLPQRQVERPTCPGGKSSNLPGRQVDGDPPSRGRGRAGETFETFANVQTKTSETSEQTVAVAKEKGERRALRAVNDSQVQHALELVKKASEAKPEDRRDFGQWLRKWRTRCRAEPEIVSEFAAEELANQRLGKGADSATRWIFRMAQQAAAELGRALKILC